jgi:hypothetical protein
MLRGEQASAFSPLRVRAQPRSRLKLGPGRADGPVMVTRVPGLVAAAVVLTALVAACGSGSTSSASQPPPHLSAVAVARDQVTNMVLTDGDLPGFSLHSTGAEKLKEQLPPKRARHYALMKRVVSANWLASEHSDVVSTDGKVQLISDANVFKSAAAVRQVWTLEQLPIPGTVFRKLRVPAGAPTGALFVYVREGPHAAFEIGWPQGRVIGYTILFAHPTDKFTAVGIKRIATLLANASTAQAQRIDRAAASVTAT